MRNTIVAVILAAVSSLIGGCTEKSRVTATTAPTAISEVAPTSLYAVAEYDAARDPTEDLAETVGKATASGKRIILEVGGEW
jgi:hypothetical protein